MSAPHQPDWEAGGKVKELPSLINCSRMQEVMHEGMLLPFIFESVEVHVDKVKAMELRKDDVLLCAYPKCGTHWMFRILDMLVKGKAEYSSNLPDFTWIDVQEMEKVGNLPSPRVLNTHFPFHMLPQDVQKGKGKVVHVYRNPKAIMVSLMFMMKAPVMNGIGGFPDITLDKVEEMVFEEKAMYRNMFYYWDSVREFEKQNPEVQIFHVCFEELKKDTAGVIQDLARYLQVPATQDLCAHIAQAVTFTTQRTQEQKLSTTEKDQNIFYRKGESNDWKNFLTVAQSDRLDDVMRKRADTCRFSRHYLHS